MDRRLETKACKACAASKRRCGKQLPQCLRCRARGIDCTYPPTKPTSFVLSREDDETPVELDLLPYNTQKLSLPLSFQDFLGAGDTRASLALDLSEFPVGLIDNQLASTWFSSLETWKVRFPPADIYPLSSTHLSRFITKAHQWLAEWLEKGSNQFIHAQLYRTRFPKCVQDAYATLSCYVHRTPLNGHAVFQILEDRAKELLAANGIDSTQLSQANDIMDSKPLDPLAHIARVQSLLIYQILGLYNGDIRLRYLSESYIPVLKIWMKEMIQHASQDVCLGGSIIVKADKDTTTGLDPSYLAQGENLLWYSWILAESIRRTWVVGSGVQATFLMMQQGTIVACEGGMMFTTRQGVWEAPTAAAWEKLCSEVHVGLMQMAETDRLFTEVSPEEVNEFTKTVLLLTFGVERVERWGVRIED